MKIRDGPSGMTGRLFGLSLAGLKTRSYIYCC